jgi:hypothetical protein
MVHGVGTGVSRVTRNKSRHLGLQEALSNKGGFGPPRRTKQPLQRETEMDIKKLQKILNNAIENYGAGLMSAAALRITYAAVLETAKSGGFTKQELFEGLDDAR